MAQINMKQAAGFLFAGAAAGAAIALLYAPQSGVRTQRDLKRFARKTVDRLDDFQVDMRDQVSDWVEDMTGAAKGGVDQGRKLAAEGYDRVLQTFDYAKSCVEDGRKRIEHLIDTA